MVITVKKDRELPKLDFFQNTAKFRKFAETGTLVGWKDDFCLVEFYHRGKKVRAWFFKDEVQEQLELPF